MFIMQTINDLNQLKTISGSAGCGCYNDEGIRLDKTDTISASLCRNWCCNQIMGDKYSWSSLAVPQYYPALYSDYSKGHC